MNAVFYVRGTLELIRYPKVFLVSFIYERSCAV